jgi:hypothetical protein
VVVFRRTFILLAEDERSVDGPRHRWKDNIKMDFKEIECLDPVSLR